MFFCFPKTFSWSKVIMFEGLGDPQDCFMDQNRYFEAILEQIISHSLKQVLII